MMSEKNFPKIEIFHKLKFPEIFLKKNVHFKIFLNIIKILEKVVNYGNKCITVK